MFSAFYRFKFLDTPIFKTGKECPVTVTGYGWGNAIDTSVLPSNHGMGEGNYAPNVKVQKANQVAKDDVSNNTPNPKTTLLKHTD